MATIVLLILAIALLFFSYKSFFPNRTNQVHQFDKQFYDREKSSLYEKNTSKERGDEFEKFVLKLFDFKNERFVLKEWRSDKIFDGIYPKSNHYPDFEIQLNTRNGFKGFAVECKYRSNWTQGDTITWAKDYQIINYDNYSKEYQIPVFVVLGVGRKPYNPNEIYIFSLEEVNFRPVIDYDSVQDFRRKSSYAKLFYDAEYNSLR